jgi:hypothetical protein
MLITGIFKRQTFAANNIAFINKEFCQEIDTEGVLRVLNISVGEDFNLLPG